MTCSDGGWSAMADAWIAVVDGGDPSRTQLLDPVVLAECGAVAGLDVLDVGCGEGRFARMLAARGARVVGLDPIPALLAEASRRGSDSRYMLGSGERLPCADASFDLVVSYLTLIDIPDFRAAIAEMGRVLRPGGRLIVANLNGFSTSKPHGWVWDDEGARVHYAVDRYLEERPEIVRIGAAEVVNWHRPMAAYMGALLGAGLTLETFLEPVPDEETVRAYPEWQDYWRAPHFHVMAWRKGS